MFILDEDQIAEAFVNNEHMNYIKQICDVKLLTAVEVEITNRFGEEYSTKFVNFICE